MSRLTSAVGVGLAISIALVTTMPTGIAGQQASKPAKGWTVPRTPDGRPDFQGYWTNDSFTPLERPADLAGKAFFTEQEAAAYLKKRTDQFLAQPKNDIHYDDAIWQTENYTKDPNRRTSLIVDPPDGKLPAETPEARKRAAEMGRARESADSAQGRSLAERCISWGTVGPPMIPPTYNANFQFLQSPDHVVIRHEMMHDVRLIALDGRAVPNPAVQQMAGIARGRWEGDTLVVETTNFTAITNFRGPPQSARQDIFASETLRVVERFTMTDRETIRYQFTAEDPSTWTRSWSGETPLRRFEGPIYEYACHEGNYGLPNILRAARVQEAGGKPVDAPTPFNRFDR